MAGWMACKNAEGRLVAITTDKRVQWLVENLEQLIHIVEAVPSCSPAAPLAWKLREVLRDDGP